MSIAAAKLNKPEVIQVYSRTAPVYDIWGILTESKARKRALELARIRDGESVLEVAVGTGLTFQKILKANPHGQNIGIDLTPAILAKAQRRAAQSGLTNYSLSRGDAYDLQYSDQQFDVLVNNYMFDLLREEDFITVLTEFKRVLKPGGRLVLINMTKGARFYQRFWEAVYHLNPKWLGGCRGVLLSAALETTGFDHIHRETVSQLAFPSEIIIATQ
jgi:ubiquinone/menaquinone biosynthesis C-methylase UbiE